MVLIRDVSILEPTVSFETGSQACSPRPVSGPGAAADASWSDQVFRADAGADVGEDFAEIEEGAVMEVLTVVSHPSVDSCGT